MCAEWIWYPGEMEARWINNFNARRYERDVFIPPLWPAAGIFPVMTDRRTVPDANIVLILPFINFRSSTIFMRAQK